MVCLLASTFLDGPLVRAQGVVIQPQQPPGGNPIAKRVLDAYEKLLQDPAYDFLEMKNTQTAVIQSARSGGHVDRAIEIAERRLATAKKRGLYGELASTWTITDLGELYRTAGQHEKAFTLLKEYGAWCAENYGPKNPETVMVQGKLVQAYLAGNQVEKAKALFNEIHGGDKQPGEAKLQILGMLQQHYFGKKDYDKVYETTLEIIGVQTALKQPDPDYPFSPTRLIVASQLLQAGRKDLTEKLIDDAWNRAVKEKGPAAPESLAALRKSAGDYLALRLGDKAIARCSELVERQTKASGPDHTETLGARNRLAEAHLAANNPEKATELLKELRTTTREKLGVEHPLTGQIVTNLTTCLEIAKKYADAEPYYREYLEIQKKISKSNDEPAVTGSMARLGMNLMKQEKWADAEKILRETLELRRKKAPQDWTTNNTESLLGEALLGQKKYEEAETLLLAGYTGLNQKRFFIPPVAQAQRVNEAVERLIRLYEATNQPAKVEQYRKLLPK
jgi:hypothetical protein